MTPNGGSAALSAHPRSRGIANLGKCLQGNYGSVPRRRNKVSLSGPGVFPSTERQRKRPVDRVWRCMWAQNSPHLQKSGHTLRLKQGRSAGRVAIDQATGVVIWQEKLGIRGNRCFSISDVPAVKCAQLVQIAITQTWSVPTRAPYGAGLAVEAAPDWTIAQKVSESPMIAGSVTAGKSRGMTEAEQIPTATSQKWNRA